MHRVMHELEINGIKVEEGDEPNYGDDPEDSGNPEDGEVAEPDYTSSEEPEGSFDDPPTDEPVEGEVNPDDEPDYTSDDGDPDNIPNGEENVNPEDEEPDYSIPDEAAPEEASVEPTPAEGGGENNDEPDYTTDGGDEGTGDGVPDSGDGSGNAEPDYTTDGGENPDEGGEEPGGEEPGGEGEQPAVDGEEGVAPSINDDIKSAEAELFKDLSPAQRAIQSSELRTNFIEMYNVVIDIIDKVNNIHKDELTLSVFEFISTQLLTLKDIINTNITRTFDTKTYYENSITYGHCISILNSVHKLIDETAKKAKKNQE